MLLVGVVCGGLLLAGCNSVDSLDIPVPPGGAHGVSPSASATSVVPTTVLERPVPGGTTTTSVGISPGTASIIGTVLGPNGPVEGATVQAERLIGRSVASTEATTAADGSFSIPGILGGRYRLRAWQTPTLDLVTPQIFFLGATATKTVSLTLTSYGTLTVTSDLNPPAPVTGETANLAILVTQGVVGATGVVTQVPQGVVSVALSAPDFTFTDGSGGNATTDASGEVIFGLSCLQAGPSPLTVTAGPSTTQALTTPTCVSPPTSSTTTPNAVGTSPPSTTSPSIP